MENFRNYLFWLFDFLSGSKIKKNLSLIRRINNNPESIESTEFRKKALNQLLKHAEKNVPFYSKTNSNNSLVQFPVVNKNIIKEHYENFLTIGADKSKLKRVVTSGSTGTPFAVYHDFLKRQRHKADTIYFGQCVGYSIGKKIAILKIWNSINRKSSLSSFMENITAIDVTSLSSETFSNLMHWLIKNKSEKILLGYASVYDSLCTYLESISYSNKINGIRGIIAASESLQPHTKEKILKHFSIHAVSRYANMENGILAQQMPDGRNEFIINWASYHISIFKMDNDSNAELGELGRIIVTDLFNYAMPMINYDTGDLGSMNWDSNHSKLVLTAIEGRRMDAVFDTSGIMVSSFTITNNMWKYTEVKQYQFIQLNKKDYVFKLNINEIFTREREMIDEFKNYFGSDANINVEYVKEIPVLNSGKRKKVVNASITT